MLAICIRLAAAIHGYLAFYMPTNRAVDWFRSPRGIKWAIPIAIVAAPAYLFVMSVCATIVDRGGPGYLNVLVLLFGWNAMKFAWIAVLSPLLMIRHHVSRKPQTSVDGRPYESSSFTRSVRAAISA